MAFEVMKEILQAEQQAEEILKQASVEKETMKAEAAEKSSNMIAEAKKMAKQASQQKIEKAIAESQPKRERILAEVPYSSVNSPVEKCLPNLLNMSFQAAEGESIQLYLDVEGVIVGTGSACAAGDIKPSHVLMAARHDAEVAHSSIRFSLGLNTTEADIERVMTVLPAIVKRLQGISTVQVADVVNAEHSNE